VVYSVHCHLITHFGANLGFFSAAQNQKKMPLQDQKSSSAYVKISRVYVSSSDRRDESQSQYDYIVDLPQQIQYVVGFEVTAYQFPASIASTFVPKFGSNPGTDTVDFSVTCSSPAVTSQFSFTWPLKQYVFDSYADSYVTDLELLLNAAVANDPVFGGNVSFYAVSDPEGRTHVACVGVNITGMSFLFASGLNSQNSAYHAMGFAKEDTPTSELVISPFPTQLRPFRFFDINIEEAAEIKPLRRIYLSDDISRGSMRSESDTTRTRLLSSQPIRNLKRLRVRITLQNGAIPPPSNIDHDFTLTVFSIANELTVPKWMNQVFVM
jgi:hypothetical protein